MRSAQFAFAPALLALCLLLTACGQDDPAAPGTQGDTTLPGTVGDLVVSADAHGRVVLNWTATGDDGDEGQATAYEARYGTDAAFVEDWASATPVPHEAVAVAAAGETQTIASTRLPRGEALWFSVRSRDEAGNLSEPSNLREFTTPSHRVWFIKVDGTGDAPTIRSACVDSAQDGDVVLVAPGTYTWTNQGDGTADKGLIFIPRDEELGNFTVRSLDGAASTVLDAEGQARVLNLQGFGDWTRGLTFEGFTFTGGDASKPNSSNDFGGGGVIYHLMSPVFRDCVFTGNTARVGGAVAQFGWGAATFENCRLANNLADAGGGFYMIKSKQETVFRDCEIVDNAASVRGGGVYVVLGNFRLENVLVAGNQATEGGGGIAVQSCHPSDVTGCTVADNSVVVDAEAAGIRVLHLQNPDTPTGEDYMLTITNSVIASNTGGPGVSFEVRDSVNGALEIGCSDVWNNDGDDIPAGTIDLGGNFGADPEFCDASMGDFHLQGSSPCAAAQQMTCGLVGALGVGCGRSR